MRRRVTYVLHCSLWLHVVSEIRNKRWPSSSAKTILQVTVTLALQRTYILNVFIFIPFWTFIISFSSLNNSLQWVGSSTYVLKISEYPITPSWYCHKLCEKRRGQWNFNIFLKINIMLQLIVVNYLRFQIKIINAERHFYWFYDIQCIFLGYWIH